MATLPQLIEDDIKALQTTLSRLLQKTEAGAGLLIDKGGFHIVSTGALEDLDTTTLAAMASASFAATQHIASLVREEDFNCVYQQGETQSLLIRNIEPYSLLVIVFRASIGVGVVKYYLESSVEHIAEIFRQAYERTPEEGLDLSLLNVADTAPIFQKKS